LQKRPFSQASIGSKFPGQVSLSAKQAQQILGDVLTAVDQWPAVAQRVGISRADIELTASAFAAHTEYRLRDK
jgi:hypothetical protein